MVEVIYNIFRIDNKYYKFLVENFLENDLFFDIIFISVNYDIYIDNIVIGLRDKNDLLIMFDYGVEFINFKEELNWRKLKELLIKLYKIYGLLNWFYCFICNSVIFILYEGGVMKFIENSLEIKCLECGELIEFIIVLLIYFKNMLNIFLSNVWNEIEKILRDIDFLIFCGYLFFEVDMYIKYMLKRV